MVLANNGHYVPAIPTIAFHKLQIPRLFKQNRSRIIGMCIAISPVDDYSDAKRKSREESILCLLINGYVALQLSVLE